MKQRLGFLVLIAVLSFSPRGLAQCFQVTHPNPQGGTIDSAEWMTMDASLRYSNHLEPGTIGSLTWGNKIVSTKFGLAGDNWDIWSFDNDYVYFFTTGTPNSFWFSGSETADPYVPRTAQLGYPGTVLVNYCNQFTTVSPPCNEAPIVPGAIYFTELSGPYSVTYSGNIGTLDTVSVAYYWDCSDTTHNSCTQLEINAYTRPYGWVQWFNYVNPNRDGNWRFGGGGPFDNITPGGPGFTNWCFG